MRFNVGVTTKPGDRLGFVQPPLRDRIVQEYGLDPRLAALAPDDATLKQYAVRSILQKQEEAARQTQEERRWEQLMGRKRQEEAAMEKEKRRRVQDLTQMSRGMKFGDLTPVQMEQMIRTNPDAAERFLYGQQANLMEEGQRRVREETKAKAQREQFEALAPNYPEEMHLPINQALAQGADPKQVQRWAEGEKKARETEKKAQAELQKKQEEQRQKVERGRYLAGRVPPEAMGEYQRALEAYDDPDKAFAHVTKLMDAERKQRENEEKERRSAEQAQVKEEQSALKFDYDRARQNAKAARKAFEGAWKDDLFQQQAQQDPNSPQAQELKALRESDAAAQQELETAEMGYRNALGGGAEPSRPGAAPPPVEAGADTELDTSRLPPAAKAKLVEALKTIPTREGRIRYVRELLTRARATDAGWR